MQDFGEIQIDALARGCRILTGAVAREVRTVLSRLREMAVNQGFEEVILPSLEPASIYADKAGDEVLDQMYVFKDKKGRDMCLRPEGTATCELIAQKLSNYQDIKWFYELRCWRYERPQAGRYREFTQFGVEWLNPRDREFAAERVRSMAVLMASRLLTDYELLPAVKRGLSYYQGDGFEIVVPSLGAQKQVIGGGPYATGVGFAVGVDRIALARSLSVQPVCQL